MISLTKVRAILFIILFLNVSIISIHYLLNNNNNDDDESFAQQQPIIKDPNLQAELFVDGLSWPTSMAFIDNNNILVLEKEQGTVRLISNGILQEEPVLEVDVDSKSERGLLGIVIMNKDAIFLYYTASSKDNEQLRNRVYQYQWNEERLVNPILILDLPAIPGPNHDGGKLIIGPDNYLYTVIGDLNHEVKL